MDPIEHITLKQIHYFKTVAACGSIRQAAIKLNLTQPTLSNQLGSLEKHLGVSLFERSRLGVLLTVEGRELLNDANRIVDSVRDLSMRASQLDTMGTGTFRFGVTPTLGPYLLPYILPSLHERYTDLKLYVREDSPALLMNDIVSGQHDLILSTQPIISDALTVVPLFREPVHLALPHEHPLATKEKILRSDLVGQNVLTLSDNHLYHRQVSELCERVGANVRRDYEGTSLDTLRQMVVMGMGIAFLPSLYIKSEIRDQSELRLSSVEGAVFIRDHALVWRKNSPQRHFYHALAKQIREIISQSLTDTVTTI